MREKHSSVTIKDVAKAAGTSFMTVTRAYRPNALVAEKTRKRVFKAAEQLGYWPNINAQALRGGKTMSVGIIMSNPVSNSIVRGLSEKLMRKGYVSYLADSLGDKKIVESCLRDFRNRSVDGVVLGWTNHFYENPEIIKLLSQMKNVILFASENVSDLSYDLCHLHCDNAYLEIVKYLSSTGRKKIVFLGRSDSDYYETIKNMLRTNNCLTDDWHWETSNYPSKPHWENYLDALKDKLAMGIKPDAILTSSDFIAARVVVCLNEYNLRVPEDIAVMGKGNSPWGTLCNTPLSTIDLQENKVTESIFSILFKRLEGDQSKPKRVTVSAEFIRRQSAG